MLGLTGNVVICGRVGRRKPFLYVLFYLCPCGENSVSKNDAIQSRKSQTLYFFNFALHFFYIELNFLRIV
jgi:hypothetical protein